jgi:hypothetical protein
LLGGKIISLEVDPGGVIATGALAVDVAAAGES